MHEYPKVIHLSGGLTLTVKSAADEAKWRATEPVVEREPDAPVSAPESQPVVKALKVEPEPEPVIDPEPHKTTKAATHPHVGGKKK